MSGWAGHLVAQRKEGRIGSKRALVLLLAAACSCAVSLALSTVMAGCSISAGQLWCHFVCNHMISWSTCEVGSKSWHAGSLWHVMRGVLCNPAA